jgi:hypothetical protein
MDRIRHVSSANVLHAEYRFAERQREVREERISHLIQMFDVRLARLARSLFASKRDASACQTARTRVAETRKELEDLALTEEEL